MLYAERMAFPSTPPTRTGIVHSSLLTWPATTMSCAYRADLVLSTCLGRSLTSLLSREEEKPKETEEDKKGKSKDNSEPPSAKRARTEESTAPKTGASPSLLSRISLQTHSLEFFVPGTVAEASQFAEIIEKLSWTRSMQRVSKLLFAIIGNFSFFVLIRSTFICSRACLTMKSCIAGVRSMAAVPIWPVTKRINSWQPKTRRSRTTNFRTTSCPIKSCCTPSRQSHISHCGFRSCCYCHFQRGGEDGRKGAQPHLRHRRRHPRPAGHQSSFGQRCQPGSVSSPMLAANSTLSLTTGEPEVHNLFFYDAYTALGSVETIRV